MSHWQRKVSCNGVVSVQFSLSVMSDSLWPHGLQHTRLPCPSPTPRVCSNSCPLRWWCHRTISSSVIPFSSHLQSFPGAGSFPMNLFCASGGQSIGGSATALVLLVNIQDWFPLGMTYGINTMGNKIFKSLWTHTCIHAQNFYNTNHTAIRKLDILTQ